MLILLTNDDGIFAPGLEALRDAVADMGELVVYAPDSARSATGRGITLSEPVAVERVHVGGRFWGQAVAGSPADCVKIAVQELTDPPPELLLAGINPGANVGINVFYSGTVAAAAEGASFGIPSVAFSLDRQGKLDFARAARLCRWVLDGLLAGGLGPGELVTVNLPELSAGRPKGVKVVPQSTAAISEEYTRSEATDGRVLFQLTDYYEHGPQKGETDVTALEEGYIAVTPLHSDLTDHASLPRLRERHWPKMPQ